MADTQFTHRVIEERGRAVGRGRQCLERYFAQALQSIPRTGAASLVNDVVVHRLAIRDIAHGLRRTGMHDTRAEEPFGISVVGDHVVSN